MSRQKPSGAEAQLANMGTVLGRVPPAEDPPPPIVELVARFQLDTEAAVAALRGETIKMVEGLERRVAALQDDWTRTRDEVKGLGAKVEDAIHLMGQSVSECINAQRESVGAAQRASASAAVFEKLRDSQPDFHRMVREQDKVVAGLRDALTHAQEMISGFGKRLDEFDVVAEDYEETKGAVRGIDTIVKDLNSEARQRRQVGGRGS